MAGKTWWQVRIETPEPQRKLKTISVVAWNHHGARSKAVLAGGYGTLVHWVSGPFFKADIDAIEGRPQTSLYNAPADEKAK